jgi:hypothetical protein
MAQHAPARRRTAPMHPRRISGPVRPRAVGWAGTGSSALPAPGPFERIRALPDKRVVDRLLRGRLCIWVIGVMLGGIVAMQVSLLRMNAGISRAVSTAAVLEQQNADLEAANARSTTGEKVREYALNNGMIDPPAGEANFLTARPDMDARLAVKHMKPPSDSAINVMNNGGKVLNTNVALAGAAGAAPTTTTTTTTTATQPVATPTPAPTVTQAQATPTPTPIPGINGGATAPQPQG